jgi:hypothetical protein
VALSPETRVEDGAPRPGIRAFILLWIGSVVFLCPEVFLRLLGPLLVPVILLLVVLLFVGRFAQPLLMVVGLLFSVVMSVVGALIGALVPGQVSQSRGSSVLDARIDVGGRDQVIAVHGQSTGVRQGDEVVAYGFRVMGVVRALLTRNLTTGQTYLNMSWLVTSLVLGLAVAIPVVIYLGCQDLS